MSNPIIAEVTRGTIVESVHRGAFVVSDAAGRVVVSEGDITRAIFPRSAIKAFQCYPLIESGAADAFHLAAEDIALCCASHDGEDEHVRTASSILAKCSCGESDLECGAHWPTSRIASNALLMAGKKPGAIYNNCSGKHAGMIALSTHLGVDPKGYVKPDHKVQKLIAKTLGAFCDTDLSGLPMGIDGCSVPTWAFGLRHAALGFARLTEDTVGRRIIAAAREHPFMIAGTVRFDTRIMKAVPRLFIKVGAEGVFCGSIAHAGLGFALKCDDGAMRGAEVAIASALSKLEVWTGEERHALMSFAHETQSNWNKIATGEIRGA